MLDYPTIYNYLIQSQDQINKKYHSHKPSKNRIDATVKLAYGKVLDIGCSSGITSVLMAESGCDVTGIDILDDSIAEAQELATQHGVSIEFIQGYAECLPFPDDTFDAVVMGEVLEHVISPRIILAEAQRVLKHDGLFLCSVPIGYNKCVNHLRFFREDDFEKLLNEYFAVAGLKHFGSQVLAVAIND